MDLKIFLNLLMDLIFTMRSQDSKMIFFSTMCIMVPFTKIGFGTGSGFGGRSCSLLDT